MLNNLTLVGRLVRNPNVKTLDNGKTVNNFTLAIQRPYKNADGEYETDFIDIVAWNGIANDTANYLKKGDVIGVRGRLSTWNHDGKKELQAIAEKVTFLTVHKDATKDEYNEPNISL